MSCSIWRYCADYKYIIIIKIVIKLTLLYRVSGYVQVFLYFFLIECNRVSQTYMIIMLKFS